MVLPSSKNATGVLYVVATPIGNLEDISARALRILGEVSVVAAEDTRMSSRLLNHYGIGTRLISLHEHNERERGEGLIERLKGGESVAVISDAGTPLVSDPGFVLVRLCIENGVRVEPIPGASAVTAALCVSGLAVDRFCFEGFLPSRAQARRSALNDLLTETRTMVFFEAPRRVLGTLADMRDVFGEDREVAVARELTKKFETVHRGTIKNVAQAIAASSDEQRGEFVVVVAGNRSVVDAALVDDDVFRELLSTMPVKQAVDLVVRISGDRRNAVYDRALTLKDEVAD